MNIIFYKKHQAEYAAEKYVEQNPDYAIAHTATGGYVKETVTKKTSNLIEDETFTKKVGPWAGECSAIVVRKKEYLFETVGRFAYWKE